MIAASSRVRRDEAVVTAIATQALDGEPGRRESRANWQPDQNAITWPDADLSERVGNLAHAVQEIRVRQPAVERDDRRLSSPRRQVTIEQFDGEIHLRCVAETPADRADAPATGLVAAVRRLRRSAEACGIVAVFNPYGAVPHAVRLANGREPGQRAESADSAGRASAQPSLPDL